MPDAAPRPTLVRRLAVAGSFGLFALAVAQAQHGCGGAEAGQPTAGPPAPVEAAEVTARPGPTAEPASAVAAPAPGTPRVADAPEDDLPENPTPAGRADRTAASYANGEAEVPRFLGASKSGRVMEPPRPQRDDTQRQGQNPAPPMQQNAAPGT